VSRGVKGELCIRGYNVMLCYWDDPEQTNKAIRQDGWYLTGYDQFYSGFITARLRINKLLLCHLPPANRIYRTWKPFVAVYIRGGVGWIQRSYTIFGYHAGWWSFTCWKGPV